MGGSNVPQPCFPPQVLTGYYGSGLCENFQNHKVRKGLVRKEEGVVGMRDLKGFWILRGSTESDFVWEGPMDHQPT